MNYTRILAGAALLIVFGLRKQSIAANPDQVNQLLKTNQCPSCDLSGADLRSANLFGANLINSNLKGANLSGVNLGSANLTDADLSSATLTRAYLYLATLENTNFNQANLSGAYLKDVTLLDNNFSGANLQGVNLSRTNLTGIALQGVDLSNANLSYTTLSGIKSSSSQTRSYESLWAIFGTASLRYEQCYNARGSDLKEMERYGLRLNFADLSNSKLRGANLRHALLYSGNLSGTDLTGADLTGAVLTCANLKNAVLDGAELKDASLEKAVLDGTSLKDVKNASLGETYKTGGDAEAAPLQAEAKQYVASMMRAEQAHYLEKGTFSNNLNDLGLGIKPETKNYRYRIFLYRDRAKAAMLAGIPKKAGIKTYIGFVNVAKIPGNNELTTITTLCESNEARPLLPKMPSSFPNAGAAECPTGFQTIGPRNR